MALKHLGDPEYPSKQNSFLVDLKFKDFFGSGGRTQLFISELVLLR